jgi:Fe-S-cluster containining protein
MNRAQRRKMSRKARGRTGARGQNRPPARINPGIVAAARANVVEIVGQGRVPERAREIPVSAFFLADHLIRRFEAENPLPHPISCQAGCDFCCFNQVQLTPPEALLIGHYIEQHFPQAEKDLLLTRVARTLTLTAGKSQTAIAKMLPELPCPLLRDHRCSVYPVRPLMCRAMHALEAARCQAELQSGGPAGSAYYAHRHDIAVSVSAGLMAGCRALGLQAGAVGLTRALDDFFARQDPVQRWLAGEEVFGG